MYKITLKNIILKKNEKLTRILFGLELESVGHSFLDNNFTPRLQAVINKWKDSYTAAELRMAYKLMKEVPDEEIQYIANQSIRFVKVIKTITNEYKRGGVTFKVESINPPWLSEEAEWANRTRKEGRSSYGKRTETIPDWVNRLIKYKNEMKTLSVRVPSLIFSSDSAKRTAPGAATDKEGIAIAMDHKLREADEALQSVKSFEAMGLISYNV